MDYRAECRRIDAFELWCWGRLLRVPWTARRSNWSILEEINPEYALEGLMLKLKLQTFVSRECMFPDSLSRHNKDLEGRTLKPPRRVTALRSWIDRVITPRSRMDRVIALRQISVTAQCYSSILFRRWQENPSLRREGTWIQRHEEKSAPARGRESWLWLLC